MRGRNNPQSSFICLVNIEDRIPRAHPIREVKRQIDQVLQSMDATFDKLYAEGGRGSVPPERLLKARVLMALYSVRSERQLCERLPYDALFQWFMDINMEEAAELAFDASVFAKTRAASLSAKSPRSSSLKSWSSRARAAGPATSISVWTAPSSTPGRA